MDRTTHANSVPPTGRAGVVALCAAFAIQHGMEVEEVEEHTKTAGVDLMRPDARIPDDALPRLWGALAARHPGKLISLEMSRAAPLSLTGDIAHGAQFASDLLSALRLMSKNSVLLADRLTVALEENATESSLIIHHPLDGLARGMLNELGFGLVYRLLGEIASEAFEPLRVEFVHEPHGAPNAYAEYFGCEVGFGRPRNAMVFRPETLLVGTSQASAALFEFAEEHLRQSRARLQGRTIPPDLRLLVQSISESAGRSRFDARTIAAGAGMSLRTAQRVASEHGSTLTELIRSSRVDLAKDALADARISVEATARLVGYSDERSFRRAFQDWTGKTPAQFRRATRSPD